MARTVLDIGETREVPFGAYARRQYRRRVLLTLLGLAMLGGAWTLYRELRPANATAGRDGYRAVLRCTACGHEWMQTLRVDQRFPVACPQCHAVAALPAWSCRDCGHEFVAQQTGGIIRCPKCDSDRVGSAAANAASGRPGRGNGP